MNDRKKETVEFISALSTEMFRFACVIALMFMLCVLFALLSDPATQFIREISL